MQTLRGAGRLREALNEISSKCRRLIHAYYLEGQSLKEAARTVELADSSVARTISRCLRNCGSAWHDGAPRRADALVVCGKGPRSEPIRPRPSRTSRIAWTARSRSSRSEGSTARLRELALVAGIPRWLTSHSSPSDPFRRRPRVSDRAVRNPTSAAPNRPRRLGDANARAAIGRDARGDQTGSIPEKLLRALSLASVEDRFRAALCASGRGTPERGESRSLRSFAEKCVDRIRAHERGGARRSSRSGSSRADTAGARAPAPRDDVSSGSRSSHAHGAT
jgi:hypothetical protein